MLLCGAFATPTLRLSAAQAVGAAAGARPTPDDWAVLADYALVDYPDDAHVALHALLHAHARRRPAAQPYAAAVRAAYVAHYLSLAEAVSRDGPALQRDHRPLLGEEPNLLAAAEALAAADDRAGLRRLWPASTSHLWQLGDHRAFERFDRLCLAAARADGDLVWAADILGEVGYVKLEAGEWAAAEGYFLEAQTIHDAAPDVLAQARLRRYRAQVALGRGQTEPALALLDEAGRLLDGAAGAEGETLARMLLHSARMTAYHRRGDLAAAAAAGQETERLFGRAGVRDDSHYGEFRVELGDVLLRLGRAEEAERQWATYVAARGDLPHRPGHAQAQLRLARLAAARGQPERAAELLRAARQTLERHGLPADEDWPAEDADDAAFR